MDPPDVAGIADARLLCPSMQSQWFHTNLIIVAFSHLFDTSLMSRFSPPFLNAMAYKNNAVCFRNFFWQ